MLCKLSQFSSVNRGIWSRNWSYLAPFLTNIASCGDEIYFTWNTFDRTEYNRPRERRVRQAIATVLLADARYLFSMKLHNRFHQFFMEFPNMTLDSLRKISSKWSSFPLFLETAITWTKALKFENANRFVSLSIDCTTNASPIIMLDQVDMWCG